MRRSDEVDELVAFVCDAEDRTGKKQHFELLLSVHPAVLRACLADPVSKRDLMTEVIDNAKPEILESKRWRCMACDRRACEMVNTPCIDTNLPIPCITDLVPLFICAAPACESEARRFTERVIKDRARAIRSNGGPDVRQKQSYTCRYCGTMKRRACGKLPHCSRCRAVWYCDAQCQRNHWPEHKAVCFAP